MDEWYGLLQPDSSKQNSKITIPVLIIASAPSFFLLLIVVGLQLLIHSFDEALKRAAAAIEFPGSAAPLDHDHHEELYFLDGTPGWAGFF